VDNSMATEKLIQLALTRTDIDPDDSGNRDPGWEAIWTLRYRASREDFEAAKRLCESPNPSQRAVGVDIIAQLGIPNRIYPEETYAILIRLLKTDNDPEVLASAGVAVGHNPDCIEAIEPLLKLKTHPDEDVRFGVAFGLLTHIDERAINALIELSSDEDDKVRDWATFGLGSMIEIDTPAIRAALYSRVATNDPSEAYSEALNGLAIRKDERVFQIILDLINEGEPHTGHLGAAKEFGDPRLYEPLVALKTEAIATIDDLDSYWMSCLNGAIEACNPSAL
jgi:HEAT repeat protein